MEFTTIIDNYHESNVYGQHIPVPEEVSKVMLEKGNRFLCTINDFEPFHCGLISRGEGRRFINLSKENSKRMKLFMGDEIVVKLVLDTSKYGMAVPREVEELLTQDPEGCHYFEALTPGKRRNLLYLINKPKSDALKLHKAFVILNYLKDARGIIDFKDLNQAIKDHPFKLR